MILLLTTPSIAQLRVKDVDKSAQGPTTLPAVEKGHVLKEYIIYVDKYPKAFELNAKNRTLIDQLVQLTGKNESELLKCMEHGMSQPLWRGKDKDMAEKYIRTLNDCKAYFGIAAHSEQSNQ